ncbi:MAG: hypothetical protein RLZZ299_1155 [Pseudomonadota bacterium]
MLVALALSAPFAAAAPAERPTLPFTSLASEDGTPAAWVNPALLGFDRDRGSGVYYATGDGGVTHDLAFAATGGGLGTTFAHRQVDGRGWWTLGSSLAVRADSRFTLGTTAHWNLPEGADNNFVAWDVGAGWRPAPWLGLAGVVRNVGSPAPASGVVTEYGTGVALRPFEDGLVLGVDWLSRMPPGGDAQPRVVGSLRTRPRAGVWLRGWVDQDLVATQRRTYGLALELRTRGRGHGGHVAAGADGMVRGGGWVQSAPVTDALTAPKGRVATFSLDGDVPYQPAPSLFGEPEESYLGLLRRLRDASADPHVPALLLDIGATPGTMAQVEELRLAVAAARAAKKPVVAYLREDAGNGAYLLASACDRVYVHPAATLDVIGLAAERQYLRGALDLIGVEAQYARRGAFKDAPETFLATGSSEASRAQGDALLDDLYAVMVDGIAAGRGMTTEAVRALVDTGPFTAAEAVAQRLVDGTAYPDELEGALKGVFPDDWERDEDYGANPDESGWAPRRTLAVVVVDGVIAGGESTPGGLLEGAATGSRTVVRALDAAREADEVKAVVLRVDSPGGSAFASDEIWRAVQRLRDTDKPVVVSMGGYAASGGYYVSAPADEIWALPSTVTGSIGIYGGKFSMGGLLDKVSIQTERNLRGRNAAMYTSSRPFDDTERAALERLIDEGYRQFKDRVARGRAMAPDRVEEVAQGRVWSGRRAVGQGLVDKTGGFFDAVEAARAKAGLGADDWQLVRLDPWTSDRDGVRGRLVRALVPAVALPPELRALGAAQALRDAHVLAWSPWQVTVR